MVVAVVAVVEATMVCAEGKTIAIVVVTMGDCCCLNLLNIKGQ